MEGHFVGRMYLLPGSLPASLQSVESWFTDASSVKAKAEPDKLPANLEALCASWEEE